MLTTVWNYLTAPKTNYYIKVTTVA